VINRAASFCTLYNLSKSQFGNQYTGCIKKSKTILKLLSIPQFCS
jgi:hypothetical protein